MISSLCLGMIFSENGTHFSGSCPCAVTASACSRVHRTSALPRESLGSGGFKHLTIQCSRMRPEVVNASCGSVKPAGSRTHDIAAVRLVPLLIALRVSLLLRHPAVRVGHADDRVVIRRRGARLEGFQKPPPPGPTRMPLLASTRTSLMPAGTLNGVAACRRARAS
jgi:hypothetical protein